MRQLRSASLIKGSGILNLVGGPNFKTGTSPTIVMTDPWTQTAP